MEGVQDEVERPTVGFMVNLEDRWLWKGFKMSLMGQMWGSW